MNTARTASALHPTGFHYSLATAFDMGFPIPAVYSDSPLADLPLETSTVEGDWSLVEMLATPAGQTNLLWFDDQVWAFALRNRLRGLGVTAVLAWDLGDGYAHDGVLAVPRHVVVFEGHVAEIAADNRDLLREPVELSLSVTEAYAMTNTAMGVRYEDDEWDWDGWTGTHVGHVADSRLAATVLSSVLAADGREAFVDVEETSLENGFRYLSHVVITPGHDSASPDLAPGPEGRKD